jgi:hypothetical protein
MGLLPPQQLREAGMKRPASRAFEAEWNAIDPADPLQRREEFTTRDLPNWATHDRQIQVPVSAASSFEWIDDFGARIWLPGRYVDLAVSVDARRAPRCSAMIENASQFLANTWRRLRGRVFLVTLCYMQLVADMGI